MSVRGPSSQAIHGAGKRCNNRRPINELSAAAEVFWLVPHRSALRRLAAAKGLVDTIFGTHGYVARGAHRGGGGGGGAFLRREWAFRNYPGRSSVHQSDMGAVAGGRGEDYTRGGLRKTCSAWHRRFRKFTFIPLFIPME